MRRQPEPSSAHSHRLVRALLLLALGLLLTAAPATGQVASGHASRPDQGASSSSAIDRLASGHTGPPDQTTSSSSATGRRGHSHADPLDLAHFGPRQAPLTGALKLLVVPCRFTGSPATPATRAELEVQFQRVADFWNQNSYGAMDLRATVLDWREVPNLPRDRSKTLDKPTIDKFDAACRETALQELKLKDLYERFNVIAVVPNLDSDFSGATGGVFLGPPQDLTKKEGLFSFSGVAHEIGHGLGLKHSSSLSRALSGLGWPEDDYGSGWDVMSADEGRDAVAAQTVGPFAGAQPPGTIALFRDQLGWMPEERKLEIERGSTQVVVLNPLSGGGGTGHLMVTATAPPPSGKTFSVEYRVQDGMDASIPYTGVLIHEVNPLLTKNPAYILDPDSDRKLNEDSSVWTADEVWVDRSERISVVVHGFDPAIGAFATVANDGPPANDDFPGQPVTALTTDAAPREYAAPTVSATIQGGAGERHYFEILDLCDPSRDPLQMSHTVWYRYDAPSTGTLFVDTQGSDFDTVLAVYQGDTLPTLNLLTCNNDDPKLGPRPPGSPLAAEGTQSRVSVGVMEGQTYYIQAGGASLDPWENSVLKVRFQLVGAMSFDFRYPLGVELSGSGRVVSAPSGISCPPECVGLYAPGAPVTLNAIASPGWAFAGWEYKDLPPPPVVRYSGAARIPIPQCLDANPQCTVNQSSERPQVIARFVPTCASVGLTGTPPSPVSRGTEVTFTATAGGPAGTPVQCEARFLRRLRSEGPIWQEVQGWSANLQYRWRTGDQSLGEYAFKVEVRDVGSTAASGESEAVTTIHLLEAGAPVRPPGLAPAMTPTPTLRATPTQPRDLVENDNEDGGRQTP